MTQEEVTRIINTYYSDKIQMATFKETDLNLLLFKLKQDGLKEFRGYSVSLIDKQFSTEEEVRSVIDQVIAENEIWYNTL